MDTIIQKHVAHITSEELPHMIRVDMLGKDYDEFNEIYDDKTRQINDPIKINTLRKYLNKLEEKGANYVALNFHTDHQEYEIDGVFIDLASEQEINEQKEKEKNYQINTIKERIKVLNIEMSRFQNKLKELSEE